MNILSCFDGMSCGQIALNRLGIKYDNYFASEIDKYAIEVTQANYPNTIQLGDITKWQEWDLPEIDLLIGGSPCQGFSLAGKGLNFDDPRSKLYFEFENVLKHYNPKWWLLENVKMKQEHEDVISHRLGIKPIMINSALLSAQNRERLYWTNIGNRSDLFGNSYCAIPQPKDKRIYLKDIIEDGFVDRQKDFCLSTGQGKTSEKSLDRYLRKGSRQVIFNQPVLQDEDILCGAWRGRYTINGKRQDAKMKTAGLTQQRLEFRLDGKTNTLTTVEKDNVVVIQKPRGNNQGGIRAKTGKTPSLTSNSWEHNNHLTNGISWRKLTPVECERLQTVSDNYTNHVSNTQRYKMLGNGWTVDVICHILSHIQKDY